ncbi:MAG: hypothetical protein MZV64_31845 [Ignavibacteriales bacterium]|nr:hypothetical protein [Ignavibacteriales bacterium]
MRAGFIGLGHLGRAIAKEAPGMRPHPDRLERGLRRWGPQGWTSRRPTVPQRWQTAPGSSSCACSTAQRCTPS